MIALGGLPSNVHKYILAPPVPATPGNTHNGKPVLAPQAKLVSAPTTQSISAALDWQTMHYFIHHADEDDMTPGLNPVHAVHHMS